MLILLTEKSQLPKMVCVLGLYSCCVTSELHWDSNIDRDGKT